MISICMASHGRLSIVEQNVSYLLSLGHDVFLCVTDVREYEYFRDTFETSKFHITTASNNPLGAKWQAAVNLARTQNPDYLVTCGSDDFLSKDYVSNAIKLTYKGFHFVGVNGWHMTDGKKHYRAKYRHLTHFPAGSGRLFTGEALDRIDYKIFDTKANRLLDDNALKAVYDKKVKTYISQDADKDGLRILAVKGKWPVMNPLEKFFTAPSIRIQEVKELPSEFPEIKL